MDNMAELIFKNRLVLSGGALGAIAGYFYYYWIGCTAGSCAITSQPVPSAVYGAFMGGLLVSMFRHKNGRKRDGTTRHDEKD